MSPPSDKARTYRIILEGECASLLAALPGGAAIETHQGQTWVLVSVCDESEFYGLLDRIHDLAIHLISLTDLGSDVPPDATPVGPGRHSGPARPGHQLPRHGPNPTPGCAQQPCDSEHEQGQ